MTDARTEIGAAGMLMTLSEGTITVRHSEDNSVLFEAKNAVYGSWSKLWKAIEGIEVTGE